MLTKPLGVGGVLSSQQLLEARQILGTALSKALVKYDTVGCYKPMLMVGPLMWGL